MPTPTIFSFTMQDNDSVKGSSSMLVAYNGAVQTVDAMIGEWLALGALLDAVTGAAIRKGSITIPLDADAGWKVTPLDGHSVSDTLNLRFGNGNTIYKTTIAVPALRDTLVVDGRPVLTAAGAIDDLAQRIVTGTANYTYVTEGADDLTTFDAAFQGIRKHRRQLYRQSLAHP